MNDIPGQDDFFPKDDEKASTASPHVLSDADLREGGFRAIRAFIRDPKSANAQRVKKRRDKKEGGGREEAVGIRQLNIELPKDDLTRETVKEIARDLRDEALSTNDLRGLVGIGGNRDVLIRCRRTLDRGGWRAWALRRIVS